MTPLQKRAAVELMQECGVSHRRACQEIGIARSSARYETKANEGDSQLMEKIRILSQSYPRFGYRRIAVMLEWKYGIRANAKRVYRLWSKMGLQLPRKRPKRKRPGNESMKLIAQHKNHVWSYDFVSDRCANGQRLKILAVVDESTRECLALEVANSIRARHLIETLGRLMTMHGKPRYIRSDNGPEFTAKALIRWLTENRIGPVFIKPGSPWQNAYIESFNGKFRDECLSREWFLNRADAKIIIEKWRHFYNHERPHSSLGNKTPAQVSGASHAA